ncbi:MAG: hypothetical protein IPM17_15695 [Verrucomicrobia bacterium]|nr:hypothetical protein [Verrucomicrobiota bacterium]
MTRTVIALPAKRSTTASRVLRPSLALALAVTLFGAGCANPIGAKRVSGRATYRQLTANALTGSYSDATRQVLHRFDLRAAYARRPDETLLALHARAAEDTRRDVLFALAELSYLRGERLARQVRATERAKAPDHHLAAAIYSWLYLLGDHPEAPPSPYDRRFRVACDLYNRSVALAFAEGPRTNSIVRMAGGVRHTGPGPVQVEFHQAAFKWRLDEIKAFLPADEFTVRGLTVRDRRHGLGAPLIAVGENTDPQRFVRHIPATALLRVDGDARRWSAGTLSATLELYSRYEVDRVSVAGREIPLEGDTTAPLAYSLNADWIWKLGFEQFFSGQEKIRSAIYLAQPYQPGRIPVIFVHGTFSSPVWWAEMWNTLRADPALRDHCQFWNFVYPSGQPIPVSAARLRDEINRKVAQLDPAGEDAALRQMVVIGHSQGGLLTKLTATETGDALWRAVSAEDFDQLPLSPAEREELIQLIRFTPLATVQRVVFICTPHRGSYLATSLVRSLAALFIRLPDRVVRSASHLLAWREPVPGAPAHLGRVPTSLDNMSPRNPWLLALADIPVAPEVAAHSIIALKGRAQPPNGGDGVVKYRSAHVDYVESEYVVRASHGCQGKASVIEEVRRILLEHLADAGQRPTAR